MHHNGSIPWYRSIRFRLVAAAVVIEICMLALLLGNSFRLISDALEQQTRGRLEALTPLLNASLSSGVFQQNYTEIQAVLNQLAGAESVTSAIWRFSTRKGDRLRRLDRYHCRRRCSTPALSRLFPIWCMTPK